MARKVKRTKRGRAAAGGTSKGPLLLIAAGLILLVGLGLWWYASNKGSDSTDSSAASAQQVNYDPADVATDQPLRGIHEMKPSTSPPPFLPKDGPQPKIEIVDDFRNLGVVPPSAEPDVTYIVRNTGDAPLTISRMYTTCGCTTADLTSRVIPPGKIAILTAHFDADFHDVRGETVRRGVILENNDRTHPQAEAWFEVTVR
jgi:hypothetical protein